MKPQKRIFRGSPNEITRKTFMNSKERVLAIVNGRPVDRIPVDLWYTDEVGKDLKEHFKVEDDFELYRAMSLDKIVWISADYKNSSEEDDVVGSQVGAGATGLRTMWGVPLKIVQAGKATYHEFGEPPLKNYETPEALEDYPYWPDPENFDYEAAKQAADNASQKYVTIGPWISFFEIYCQMRSLQQSLMDLMLNESLANAILDRIEDCQTQMLKKYLSTLGDSIDLVFVSDDMGMQENLLVSPDIWSKFFKDRMKRWCELIHSYNKKVFYHSDGAVEALIPGLLDCGIDILNPIQHVCEGMNTAELKKKYGNRLIFHGGVDNQSVLPFGSPEDVKKETQNCLDTLGSDNKGYIVCSCHNVQAGTPIENITAMIETVLSAGPALENWYKKAGQCKTK
jgi:uroporphyrinogen decarboxylase